MRRPSFVGIVKLGNSGELDLFCTALLLELTTLFELGEGEDIVNNRRLCYLFQKLVGKFALLVVLELLWTSRQKVFRLAVKGWIVDETIDKDTQVVLDLLFGDLTSSLVLFLNRLHQMSGKLVRDIGDVISTYDCIRQGENGTTIATILTPLDYNKTYLLLSQWR